MRRTSLWRCHLCGVASFIQWPMVTAWQHDSVTAVRPSGRRANLLVYVYQVCVWCGTTPSNIVNTAAVNKGTASAVDCNNNITYNQHPAEACSRTCHVIFSLLEQPSELRRQNSRTHRLGCRPPSTGSWGGSRRGSPPPLLRGFRPRC